MIDDRALIFANLINGVPPAQVAQAFDRKSESEVLRIFNAVLRKIKSYCYLRARGYREPDDPTKTNRAYPIIVASNVKEAQNYKLTCLAVLPKLNLDKEPQYKDIYAEVINPDNVMTVTRNLSA